MLNTPKGLYDTCPNPSSRALRADRYTTIDLFKENYNQPEQLGKKLISKTQGLSERSNNYSDVPKRKDSQQILELKEAIEKNEEYQQACMKELKLKEAQETKENIKELKRGLLQKQKSQIEEKYQFDLKVLMEAQAEEMNEFNEFWDDKVAEYESEATRVENEVLERHQQEVFKVKDELRKTVPMKKKVSTQYLSYKKMLENLVKQKEFLEAEKVKAICEELEKEERSKAYNEKEQKIKIFMGQLDQRHRNELNVLRKRITAGREGLLKARVMELEKLLLKFQNARYQLEKDKQSGLSKLEVTQRNSMVGEESAYRSSCKAPSNRTYRNSGTTIRMRDSSKMNSLNASMVSPTSNADIQHLSYLSPPAHVGKHKRSQTIVGKDFNVAEVCSMLDQPIEVKSKRSNSVIKQNIDNHEFWQVL